ncbi:MAG: RNA polymerase sigma factor [bacterium]
MKLRYFLEDQLVIGFLNGDRDNTIKLFKQIKKNCMVYLSEEDSEDVAQEVLIGIQKKKDKILDPSSHPGAYATDINRGKLSDELRKRGRRREEVNPAFSDSEIDGSVTDESSEIGFEIRSNDPSPIDILEHNELFKLIKKIGKTAETEALKKGWKALKYVIIGFSYSTIAEIMGVPESTIKSWINRFREYLRRELLKYGWDRHELNKAMGF